MEWEGESKWKECAFLMEWTKQCCGLTLSHKVAEQTLATLYVNVTSA